MTSSGTAVIRPNAVQFIATEMLADSRLAFSAGLTVATALNALMRPMTVPSSPQQRCQIREGGQIVRALLELRHDAHQAFFHGLLDVIAALGILYTGQAVGEYLPDGRTRLRSHLCGLAEIAMAEQRLDLLPERAVAAACNGEIHETLDRDHKADHGHHCDRIHEMSAVLEEAAR